MPRSPRAGDMALEPHRLTAVQARRIVVRAQLLARSRPTSLLEVVRHLAAVQVDNCRHVAPSHELVLWSRLGAQFDVAEVDRRLADGSLIEIGGMLRPGEDIALYRAEMAAWPGGERPWQQDLAEWVAVNDEGRRAIRHELEVEGPLPARALPDVTLVPWRSSGWTNDKNTMRLLEMMARRGEVAVAGRGPDGREWDLAERVYPDSPTVPLEEALRIRDERRLTALGVARATVPEVFEDVSSAGAAGEPAVIEGVKGTWRVDPGQLGQSFGGRTALLSPLDRLVFDRKRTLELFGFDYQLEMYKPAAKRRWGYWAMPVLHGDRLIGKVDAQTDRTRGVLRVNAIHEDAPWPGAARGGIRRELAGLAEWLGVELQLP
ncbi:DNA glycosylase AlkZ-like family protein [Nostocoides australiense]|nr:crosslink repair DNA glycosylase YcaQ family protein [Tetrasphaera australiensis]